MHVAHGELLLAGCATHPGIEALVGAARSLVIEHLLADVVDVAGGDGGLEFGREMLAAKYPVAAIQRLQLGNIPTDTFDEIIDTIRDRQGGVVVSRVASAAHRRLG